METLPRYKTKLAFTESLNAGRMLDLSGSGVRGHTPSKLVILVLLYL